VFGQDSLPELAISGAACHSAQQVRIYLDHFFDGLRGDVRATSGARVYRHNHATLIFERKRGRASVEVDLHTRVGFFVHFKKTFWVSQWRPLDAADAWRDPWLGGLLGFLGEVVVAFQS